MSSPSDKGRVRCPHCRHGGRRRPGDKNKLSEGWLPKVMAAPRRKSILSPNTVKSLLMRVQECAVEDGNAASLSCPSHSNVGVTYSKSGCSPKEGAWPGHVTKCPGVLTTQAASNRVGSLTMCKKEASGRVGERAVLALTAVPKVCELLGRNRPFRGLETLGPVSVSQPGGGIHSAALHAQTGLRGVRSALALLLGPQRPGDRVQFAPISQRGS